MTRFQTVLLSVLFSCGSCRFQEPVFITSDNLSVKGLSGSILRFSMDSQVYNPTRYKYQLKDVLFDIWYDGVRFGSGKLNLGHDLFPKDTTVLSFDCFFDLKTLQEKQDRILSKDTVEFQFVGEAFAVHPLKKIRKDFAVKVPFGARKFITDAMFGADFVSREIEIQNLASPRNYGLARSNYRFRIGLQNKHPINITLKRFRMEFKAKGTARAFATTTLDTVMELPGLKKVQLPLKAELHHVGLLKNMGSFFWGNGNSQYTGVGSIRLGIASYEFEVPIEKDFDVQINPFQWPGGH